MLKKILTSTVVVASIAGATAAPTSAWADHGRRGAVIGGVAAGVVGGALLGSALNRDRYPERVEECHWERQRVYDRYEGAYIVRRVRVCD